MGIIVGFGVPRENNNGRRVIDFCAERGLRRLSVSNTYFEHRSLRKYIRVTRSQDGVEVKTMIDLVLMKKAMLCYVQDGMAVRRMERGLSDHRVVLCKVRLVGTCIKRREVGNGARRSIRREKLREHQYME